MSATRSGGEIVTIKAINGTINRKRTAHKELAEIYLNAQLVHRKTHIANVSSLQVPSYLYVKIDI